VITENPLSGKTNQKGNSIEEGDEADEDDSIAKEIVAKGTISNVDKVGYKTWNYFLLRNLAKSS